MAYWTLNFMGKWVVKQVRRSGDWNGRLMNWFSFLKSKVFISGLQQQIILQTEWWTQTDDSAQLFKVESIYFATSSADYSANIVENWNWWIDCFFLRLKLFIFQMESIHIRGRCKFLRNERNRTIICTLSISSRHCHCWIQRVNGYWH